MTDRCPTCGVDMKVRGILSCPDPWHGTDQLSLFDGSRRDMAEEAARRRDDAIRRVEDHSDTDVRKGLLQTVRLVAGVSPTLTSEDVFLNYHGNKPREPRVLGAVFREAKRYGWIVPTDDWRLSVRPECHRRPQRVWRSLLFEEAGTA